MPRNYVYPVISAKDEEPKVFHTSHLKVKAIIPPSILDLPDLFLQCCMYLVIFVMYALSSHTRGRVLFSVGPYHAVVQLGASASGEGRLCLLQLHEPLRITNPSLVSFGLHPWILPVPIHQPSISGIFCRICLTDRRLPCFPTARTQRHNVSGLSFHDSSSSRPWIGTDSSRAGKSVAEYTASAPAQSKEPTLALV